MACCGAAAEAADAGIPVTDTELAGATLVDSHCHLKSTSRAAGGPAVFAMSTSEDDWPREIAGVYGIGVHPFFADAVKIGWEQRLREALAARPGCLVGEFPSPLLPEASSKRGSWTENLLFTAAGSEYYLSFGARDAWRAGNWAIERQATKCHGPCQEPLI